MALGVLRTPSHEPVPDRLASIWNDIGELFGELPPAHLAIERVFFQVNVRTAIGVAQAAGIVMAAARSAGAEVSEYSPNAVKQAVTGDGSADKVQMETMVQRLLDLDRPIRPVDAADAAAVGLCHLAHAPMRARVAGASGAASAPGRPGAANLGAVGRREEWTG